MKSSQPTSCSF